MIRYAHHQLKTQSLKPKATHSRSFGLFDFRLSTEATEGSSHEVS